MRVIAILLFTLCIYTQVVQSQWLRCNFAQDTNVSIVLTNEGCQDDFYRNVSCVRNVYPGLPILFGECVLNDAPPQRGYKANVHVFYNSTVGAATPEIDYQERYDSEGYYLRDWLHDMFFVYWNDTGVTEQVGNDSIPLLPSLELDVVGNSLGRFRSDVEQNQVEILVGNYITRLGSNDTEPLIQVVIGDDAANNQSVWFAGYGASAANRFVVNYTDVIPVRIYGPTDCIGYDVPLWNGYINASNILNETFIGFYGDYVNREVYALYGRMENFTQQLTDLPYVLCNFVNAVENDTLLSQPEPRNVSFTLGAYPQDGTCGRLKDDILSDSVPYGTCVRLENGPAPGTWVRKVLYVTEILNGTGNFTGNGTGNFTDFLNSNATDANLTDIVLFNDTLGLGVKNARTYGDGTDFFIAYFVDHYHGANNDSNDYTVEFPRDDTWLGYETFCSINGTLCSDFNATDLNDTNIDLNQTSINATWTPTEEYQTYIIGTYAANWVNLTDLNSTYVTIAFNDTWWTVCPVSTYDFRSCVITVPAIDPEDVWNITLYNVACYATPDNCSDSYVDSTLVNFGNASVGLVAWYGDWSTETFVTTYNRGGVWWNVTQPMIQPDLNDTDSSSSSSSSTGIGGDDLSSSTGPIDLSSSGGFDLSSSTGGI